MSQTARKLLGRLTADGGRYLISIKQEEITIDSFGHKVHSRFLTDDEYKTVCVTLGAVVEGESEKQVPPRPDAGEGLVEARRAWHRQRGATQGLSCPTTEMCEAFDAGWKASRRTK